MPIDPEVLKVLQGGAWASAAGALTQDPSAATPAVTRADGFGPPYSATLVMEQETLQGRWNEFDSAIIDIFESGVPFYDAGIDYPEHAMTNENGVLSRALIANGPTAGNAIAPSADTAGTTWAQVSGTQSAPGAPAQPTATSPAPGTLAVSWNCPLDGGSAITEFEFQYRVAGGSWPGQTRTTTIPTATLTGLTNGQALEFRVRAVNAIGNSDWSPTGTGTPTATAPIGGSALALTATGGDTNAVLNWLEPDTGGSPIIRYEVQWRNAGQTFNTTRQNDVTDTTATVTGLMNGTEYFFRVRAVNSAGESTWSNEATATPRVFGTPFQIAAGAFGDSDTASQALTTIRATFATIGQRESAEALQAAGYTATQVAQALQAAYSGITATQVAQALQAAGYTATQVAQALQAAYSGITATQVAQALQAAGYTATQVAQALIASGWGNNVSPRNNLEDNSYTTSGASLGSPTTVWARIYSTSTGTTFTDVMGTVGVQMALPNYGQSGASILPSAANGQITLPMETEGAAAGQWWLAAVVGW